MKNLVILNRGFIFPESRTFPDLEVTDTVFDTISDSVTFALASAELDVIEVQQFTKNGTFTVLASFEASGGAILSFSHFVDSCQLVFVFENGDLVSATYDMAEPDPDTSIVEIIGSFDGGLHTACWSPDEETLTLLTKENKLVLLSRLFEPVNERVLNPDDIKISDEKHVSVGWGKEETQFKGKGARALEREREALMHAGLDLKDLKEDSPLRDPTVGTIQKGTVSTFDSHKVEISWRGDGEYFAVSTIEPVLVETTQETYDRRVIRVFTREGELDSVSEPVDGLENNLAWKPQGGLIASTQRHIDEDGDFNLKLVFYERNGLRHGQFNTRLNPHDSQIMSLAWSADSEILAFHLKDRVQFWTSKNYHWYLKQEIHIENEADEFNFVKFHPEKPLHLMIGTVKKGVQVIDLSTKIVSGPSKAGHDVGMTIVVDGTVAKITPLSIANVPPPISFREFELEQNITDICVNESNEKYGVVTSKNYLYVAELTLKLMKEGNHPVINHEIKLSNFLPEGYTSKQVCFVNDHTLLALADSHKSSHLLSFDLRDNETTPTLKESFDLGSKIVLMKSDSPFSCAVFQMMNGCVCYMDESARLEEISKFPQVCKDFEVALIDDDEHSTVRFAAFGLSTNGKLFANERQIATGVTSIKISESHLLFTTAQSQLCFIHLKSVLNNFQYSIFLSDADSTNDERIRQIERGSFIVAVMPSKYSVVLEAPRGNLETICPRIMVLAAVRGFIEQKRFKEAFLVCRTHRIDLDILHDYNPELFYNNLETFIDQVDSVDHLDLFVSCLHEENVAVTKYKNTINEGVNCNDSQITENNQPQDLLQDLTRLRINNNQRIIRNRNEEKDNRDSKVNRVCGKVLSVLLKPHYAEKYLQTIITAYACQKPPNLSEALTLVGTFKDQERIDQSVSQLCFLQDVNKLYNTALSLYNIKLALTIAQKSQMDPKEYLPFLQNIHVQPESRKRFMVDDYLKNYEKALHYLYEMGDSAQDEFDTYVVSHGLYKVALGLYKYNQTRTNDILMLYAEFLHDQKKYDESALTFEYLKLMDKALENYILGKKWKEAMTLTSHSDLSEKSTETAERLITSLTDDHKYADAAEIEFNFLQNINHAIELYCKSYNFDDAILLATKEQHPDLIGSIVDVQLGEGFGTIAELLADCKSQVNSQLNRLRELREKKAQDPHAFYGTGNDEIDAPDNVSVAQSETSTAPSFFTRYTGKTAGTAKTGASRRTSKNRKREERKRAKGRKGTIYEEEYLIRSVGRLLERLDQTQPEAVRLIEGLIRRNMKEQAYQIQKNWLDLTKLLSDNIVEIHSMSERDRERVDDNGEVYLMPEIPVPAINKFPAKDILDY